MRSYMNLVLISTTDMKGGRADVRDRMLHALVESERTLRGDRMMLALLLQNCPPPELHTLEISLPAFVRPVAVAGRVPLSTARNILLRQLAKDRAIATDTVVAFPDDDCSDGTGKRRDGDARAWRLGRRVELGEGDPGAGGGRGQGRRAAAAAHDLL